jgi:hypothetical protein
MVRTGELPAVPWQCRPTGSSSRAQQVGGPDAGRDCRWHHARGNVLGAEARPRPRTHHLAVLPVLPKAAGGGPWRSFT